MYTYKYVHIYMCVLISSFSFASFWSIRTATHCNALQRASTHCNTLQHTRTHCNTLKHTHAHIYQKGYISCVWILGLSISSYSTYPYMYTHTHMHTNKCVCIYTYRYINIYTLIHAHIPIYNIEYIIKQFTQTQDLRAVYIYILYI